MIALLFASLAMCSTLAGGFLAIAARRRIHLLMGLELASSSAVFFDLLPESLAVAREQGWSVRVYLASWLSASPLLFNRTSARVACLCEEDCDNQVHPISAALVRSA